MLSFTHTFIRPMLPPANSAGYGEKMFGHWCSWTLVVWRLSYQAWCDCSKAAGLWHCTAVHWLLWWTCALGFWWNRTGIRWTWYCFWCFWKWNQWTCVKVGICWWRRSWIRRWWLVGNTDVPSKGSLVPKNPELQISRCITFLSKPEFFPCATLNCSEVLVLLDLDGDQMSPLFFLLTQMIKDFF